MAKLTRDHEKWKQTIKTLLEDNLMSQKDFAKKCGVSAQTVSNWLSDVRTPGIYAKRKILQIINDTKQDMKKNNDILQPIFQNAEPDKDKFERILKGMTLDQQKELMGTMGKLAKSGKTGK